MTELEKLDQRLGSVRAAIAIVQNAVTVERKLSSEKTGSGHLTKALTELNMVKTNLESQIKRHGG